MGHRLALSRGVWLFLLILWGLFLLRSLFLGEREEVVDLRLDLALVFVVHDGGAATKVDVGLEVDFERTVGNFDAEALEQVAQRPAGVRRQRRGVREGQQGVEAGGAQLRPGGERVGGGGRAGGRVGRGRDNDPCQVRAVL